MRQFSSHIYRTFITSQAWVAFCVALLVWYFQLGSAWYSATLIWMSFFSTLFAYNLAYWIEEKLFNWRMLVMIISVIFCIYLFFNLEHLDTQVLLIVMGLISIFYSIPYRSFKLRKIPGFKIFWIALVWAVTVCLIYVENHTYNTALLWYVLSAFTFILGITIPFDLRDYYTDHQSLRTIPQRIGIEKSIQLSIILLLVSLICFSLANQMQFNLYFYAFALTIFIGMILCYLQKFTASKWYTAFWIEGLSAMPFIIFKIVSALIS
ncbi:hypothetical protein GO491_06515 [Flavobacteriaceae bacterium Ap0902]|nr:hypothetical protein [Flavobacteriaceae bacterium Ap0902]